MVWPQNDFPAMNITISLKTKDLGEQFFLNLRIVPSIYADWPI